MSIETDNTTSESVGAKEITLGKFAAILLGPAAFLLTVFTITSLISCGGDCEAETAGVICWGSPSRSWWLCDSAFMG